MRRSRAALVAIALVGASLPLTAAPAAAAPRAAAATVSWGACDDPDLDEAGAQCGTLEVPMDHANPAGAKVTLALSRVRHKSPDSQYQGIMLVNPGGPGGSGKFLSILGNYVPKAAGFYYDWIGFDPRGVGESTPRLSCDPSVTDYNRPDYVVTNAAEERVWLARARSYADACDRNNQPLLQHMHTTDVARDVDDIRAALGEQKINWYGFSYGTYIGEVYATLFPQRVRRMVLDGVIDPTRVFYFTNLDQNRAFDVASRVWFDWIARHDDTYDLGTTASAVAARYYGLRSSLKGHPVDGRIGPSEFDDIFVGAGYAQFLWPFLTGALSQAAHGDVDVLLGYFPGPRDDNGYATYAATECTDAPWAPSWSRWRQDSERYYRTSPFLTWGNTWFNAPCFFWHVAATRRVEVTGNGVAPILLVSQTLDAATPYAGALRTRSLFGNSVLIAEPGGTTHAGSLFGNECTDGLIADYLATGALPARQGGQGADAICQPLPEPEPFPAGAPASTSGSSRARLYRLGMAR